MFQRNKYDATCCTRSIDCRTGCILQHSDALNVVRVQCAQVAFNIVYKHQWGTAVDGQRTSDVKRLCHTRSRTTTNGESRHGSLQCRSSTYHRPVAQDVFHFHLCHRPCEICLLLSTIAYDNDFVKCFDITLQNNVHPSGRFHCCFLHSYIGNRQHGTLWNINDKLPINIGYHTFFSSCLLNNGSYDCFTIGIYNHTLNRSQVLLSFPYGLYQNITSIHRIGVPCAGKQISQNLQYIRVFLC